MADLVKIGQRVEVTAKSLQGVIAFVGKTSFATGKWIGLILDEPKGKNDGSVQGTEYFKALDAEGKPIVVPKTADLPASKIARSRATTMSLASSRQSLADSRQSLSGSRQSLAGSRSHLASPASEKPLEIAEPATSKRASFVEFVETLKPQFTPGAVLVTPTPITSIDEKLSQLQLQQELENNQKQMQELNEKIETLKIKRQEDKQKLKDYDKLKIQLEQLIEFKAKILEAQNCLQRELQRAKLDVKEAVEAKEAHAEEVADLYETVEMATLDKEMAEEKAELLQAELEACKEKLDEVTLDLQILKTEMDEKGVDNSQFGVDKRETLGTTPDDQAITTYEVKQLQQQNARLRETLIKLRDISAHDKHEHQRLLKDIEQKKSEITELGKTKEKLSARVESMEQQISDLQEQVDAALGADEMIVILSEHKLNLEEKVACLQEEVAELEALQDMNDQLVEGNAELEADLREELDIARAEIREAVRKRDAAFETIADQEATIGKFRGLVQQLQEQSLNLQRELEKETSKPVKSLPEIADFKKMFTETKAHTKAIDLDLRRLDEQQLQQHIKYLSSYMPDSFMNRGGDHDAVLTLLLICRLIHKSDILLGQIKEKFPVADKVDRAAVLKGHALEQYSFRCRMSCYIFALQSVLHQYNYCVRICKPETLLKLGSAYPEMSAQEKVIDSFVDLVKRDQLDENILLEPLEKCYNYFKTMFPILLANENKVDQNHLLSDNVKVLLSAVDAFSTDARIIRCLSESANVGDICLLAQHVITTSEQLQRQLKLVKRRLPVDLNITNLCLEKDLFDNLTKCFQHAGKILKTVNDVARNATLSLATSGETEKGLSQEKIKEIAMVASDKVYEQEDLGPVQSIKQSLSLLLTQIANITKALQDNELQFSTNTDENDYEMSIEKLQRKLEEAHNNYKRKEKEFEETLDHLQTDIDSLENEKGEMKEKMKMLTKKAQIEASLTRSMSGSTMPSLNTSLGPNLPAVVRDSPLLLQEIENLRLLFHNERNKRIELEAAKLKRQLDSMAPLPSFKNVRDEIIEELFKEGEILMTLAKPSFPSFANIKPGAEEIVWKRHFADERNKIADLQKRARHFQNRAIQETIRRKHGGRIDADFHIFPTKEMVKAVKESNTVNFGFVKIPKLLLSNQDKPGTINLNVDINNLQKILDSLKIV
ncbi:hypothetical protein YQE_07565, partial [Dendroctonus ponderosae]